jgi:hypothetical protein
MSIVVRFPQGGTSQEYDEVTRRIQASDQWPPDGLEYHVAFGPSDNLYVSEVWESREHMEAFGESLIPVLREVGIPAGGEPEVFEVHNIFKR